jgi:hypothetical protein
MRDSAGNREPTSAPLLDDAQRNLCRAQANECLLLAIGTPDDAVAVSGISVGWESLADRIDLYTTRGNPPLILYRHPELYRSASRTARSRRSSQLARRRDDFRGAVGLGQETTPVGAVGKGILHTGRVPLATFIVQPAYRSVSPNIISRIIALPKARAALSSANGNRPAYSWSLPSAL